MKSRKPLADSWLFGTVYYLMLAGYCLLLISCSTQDSKLQQYKVQGEVLYRKNCSNCHQKNGKGLGLVYPPVDISDYVDNNLAGVICLMENGKEGELLVNGQSYNKPMPAMPTLTDLEIAEITTYLYNSWGRSKGIIEVTEVSRIIRLCE